MIYCDAAAAGDDAFYSVASAGLSPNALAFELANTGRVHDSQQPKPLDHYLPAHLKPKPGSGNSKDGLRSTTSSPLQLHHTL